MGLIAIPMVIPAITNSASQPLLSISVSAPLESASAPLQLESKTHIVVSFSETSALWDFDTDVQTGVVERYIKFYLMFLIEIIRKKGFLKYFKKCFRNASNCSSG